MQTIFRKLMPILLMFVPVFSLYSRYSTSYSDFEYEFDYEPPAGAEINTQIILYMKNSDELLHCPEVMVANTMRTARVENDIYLEMFILPKIPRTQPEEVRIWVKTRMENGKIIFPNRKKLMTNTYCLNYNYDAYPFYEKEDKSENVYLYNVNVKELVPVTIYLDHGAYFETKEGHEFKSELKNEPVEAEIIPDPLLIRNPDSYLSVSSEGWGICPLYTVSNNLLISDFIIGNSTHKEPETLPELKVYSHYSTNIWTGEEDCFDGIEVKMDIVTDESYLLNFKNIYILYREKGCSEPMAVRLFGQLGTSYGGSGFFGNPFKESHNIRHVSEIMGTSSQNSAFVKAANEGKLEVMCYYLKRDGTRVETPWVTAVQKKHVSGVESVEAAPQIEDGRTYDITGREVKGDVLTPGIYIRNGRKFIVPRR